MNTQHIQWLNTIADAIRTNDSGLIADLVSENQKAVQPDFQRDEVNAALMNVYLAVLDIDTVSGA